MLNCKEMTAMCSREQDMPLGLREKLSLRTHVLICPACRSFRKQMAVLRQAMQTYADGKAVTAEPDEPHRDRGL